ncbi:MAG: hypothetical protein ACLFP1_04700 [Candidatus Goldiibacteriota bacterium]
MKKNKKHFLAAAILSALLIPAFNAAAFDESDEKDPYLYSPNNMDSLWIYNGYWQNKPEDNFDFEAYIQNKHIDDEKKVHYVYYTPIESTKNVIYADETGCYISSIRYPVPFMDFLFFTVDLEPPIPMMLYPLEVGKKWEVDFTGTIDAFKLFKIKREGTIKAEIKAKEIITVNGKDIKTYKIQNLIDDGGGKGFKESIFWFGKGAGYVRGDTPVYHIELLNYDPKGRGR